MKTFQKTLYLPLIGIGLASSAVSANAALLGLSINPSGPDFQSAFMDISYTASSEQFQIENGFTVDYSGGSVPLVDVGEYDLTATIDHTGKLVGGTVDVY